MQSQIEASDSDIPAGKSGGGVIMINQYYNQMLDYDNSSIIDID